MNADLIPIKPVDFLKTTHTDILGLRLMTDLCALFKSGDFTQTLNNFGRCKDRASLFRVDQLEALIVSNKETTTLGSWEPNSADTKLLVMTD